MAGISRTMGDGLSSVLDDEHIKERKEQKKSNNLVEGLGRGMFSLGKGILDGVTGLVEQPYKEIKKKGGEGVFSGIGKGLFGLAAKPLVGVSVFIYI